MGNRNRRQAALDDAVAMGEEQVDEVEVPCAQPKLTDLDVLSGASGGVGMQWWTVVDPNVPVQLLATTAPNNGGAWGAIAWGGPGNLGGTAQLRNVLRPAVAQHVVTAQLNSPLMTATIDVYDLVQLGCDLPTHVGGTTWKGYAGHVAGNLATLTATTNPDTQAVWSHLVWQPAGSAGAQAKQQGYDVTTAGDRQVSVVLGNVRTGTKTLAATLHICQWPRLQIDAAEFDSLTVHNDGKDEIDVAFDKHWRSGRPAPAAGKKTDKVQSVLCYAAGTKISVAATFKVTTKPTETETVEVEGHATVAGTAMKWSGTVQVKPADATVKLAKVAADKALPAGVRCEDAFTIAWRMKDADNATWVAAGSTVSQLYVTRAAPAVTPYWTLLDLSCRAAAGKTTEDDVVAESFKPFKAHTGDGNGIPRKGDGVKLSYYIVGVDTDADDSVYDTQGILSRADGTGRCGGWADVLLHTLAIHGITGSPKVRRLAFFCAGNTNGANTRLRFQVKNCTFVGAGTSTRSPYTHRGEEVTKANGVAGQGKTNPQFDFSDHVAVHYGGNIYDPSYGVGPIGSQAAYEVAAIAGLGTMARTAHEFTMGDGTPQFIAGDCCAGYFKHQLKGGETLDTVALPYGKTGADIWNHRYNRAVKRVGANPPPVGTVLYIPREWDPTKEILDGQWC